MARVSAAEAQGRGQPAGHRCVEHEAQVPHIEHAHRRTMGEHDRPLRRASGELKAKPGGELQVHGCGALIRWLLANELVDEINLLIPPTRARRIHPALQPASAALGTRAAAAAQGRPTTRRRDRPRPPAPPPPALGGLITSITLRLSSDRAGSFDARVPRHWLVARLRFTRPNPNTQGVSLDAGVHDEVGSPFRNG